MVAAQPVSLGGALLVGPGAGHDDHVGDVGVLVLDGGPGVFEGGDDAPSPCCSMARGSVMTIVLL